MEQNRDSTPTGEEMRERMRDMLAEIQRSGSPQPWETPAAGRSPRFTVWLDGEPSRGQGAENRRQIRARMRQMLADIRNSAKPPETRPSPDDTEGR